MPILNNYYYQKIKEIQILASQTVSIANDLLHLHPNTDFPILNEVDVIYQTLDILNSTLENEFHKLSAFPGQTSPRRRVD